MSEAAPDSEMQGSAGGAMRIAAVIPTYNHAALVGCAIDSVLAQTRPVDEILVVDDGSTDETARVVRAYGPQVRYLRQENRGLSGARNAGLRASTCEWVAFLDADDWWLPEKIALQEQRLRADPGAVLCYSGVRHVFPDGLVEETAATNPARVPVEIRYRNCITGSGSAAVVRRDALLEIGGFRESLTACEDWDAWCRMTFQRRRFTAAPEPVTAIRIRPQSMSSDAERMLKNVDAVLESTLLEGLSGWARFRVRRRVRSAELYRAAVSAREDGSRAEWRYLLRSLGEWPPPWFAFRRYKRAALLLLRKAGVGAA